MKNIFALLLMVTVGYAGKGSVYSRYGVGDINTFLSGKNIGMGNTGLALFGETHINLVNPASAASINRTLLSASYQYKNFTSEDAFAKSIIGTGSINSFALAFPVYEPKKMVLTLGMVPFSSVGYDLQTTQTVAGNSVVQNFEGRGGINSGQLGVSYALNSDITLGMTAHYLFGSIYRDQTITFLTGNVFGGSFNQRFSTSGFGVTLGGIYSGVDKALGFSDSKQLNIGLALFSGSSLSVNEQTLRNFPTGQDTVAPGEKTMQLPLRLSFGSAYLLNKTIFAADVHFQHWDNFSIGGIHPAEINNSIRFNAGVEFLPVSDFSGDDLVKRMSYRFGGYYHLTNLKMNGKTIDEIFGSAGVSFPMSFDSRIHLALEYGIRGTTTSSLIRDTIVRFTVSVSASELMFIQPPIE